MSFNKSAIILVSVFLAGLLMGFLIKSAIDNSAKAKVIDYGDQAGVAVSKNQVNQLEPQLEILNYRFDNEGDFAYLRGEVKNIGHSELNNIEALANVYDENKSLLDSAKGYIDLNPLMAGQSSAFQIMFKPKPNIRVAKVVAFRAGNMQIPFLIASKKQ